MTAFKSLSNNMKAYLVLSKTLGVLDEVGLDESWSSEEVRTIMDRLWWKLSDLERKTIADHHDQPCKPKNLQ